MNRRYYTEQKYRVSVKTRSGHRYIFRYKDKAEADKDLKNRPIIVYKKHLGVAKDRKKRKNTNSGLFPSLTRGKRSLWG